MIILPVYNKFIVPDADIYFRKDVFEYLAGKAEKEEKAVILFCRNEEKREDMNEDSFYPIGVSGVVKEISNEGFILVHTGNRVNVDSVSVIADHSISLMVSKREDINDLSEDVAISKLFLLKQALKEFTEGFDWAKAVSVYFDRIESFETAGAMLSVWMKPGNSDCYAVIEVDSKSQRVKLIEKMIYEFIEVTRVTNDAANAQQKEYQDIYKESAIKKQLEFLQKELDDMHPDQVSDIRKLEMKIAESGMNDAARKEADKLINRLRQEGKNSPESGMLYDYLDFLTSLNWKKQETGYIDLNIAAKILDQDHYGLKKVKRRIIQQIAVMNLKQEQSGSILLFVGAPGTGKTSIGRSIARALNREYVRVSLGGVRDEADIRGHRRTYIGAMPGRIMDGIQKSGVSNPVMVLDEVDKLSSSYNGDPASALLEVLDPEQNNTFTDHYMNVPYDLSDVLFICTANSIDTIPQPLLDRMELIQFDGYTPDEKLAIAKEHLLPSSMKEMGICSDRINISDEVIKTIISDFTREAGVRGLRKRIDTLCRTAAVAISSDPEYVFQITPEQIRDDLDMKPTRRNHVPEVQKAGVITGIAWTQTGGEILYVESLFTKGDGKLVLTGQLGDVMKESAQIAVSLVKAMYPDKAHIFRENDLHIHVPEGAVPKDGPSAGVTMTTAIASLVSCYAVSPKIAMTGEISLRGIVSAIGGLPEKLMAAQRAGVKTVLIPSENIDDLRDVPEETKKSLMIIPVSDIREVLAQTGVFQDNIMEFAV